MEKVHARPEREGQMLEELARMATRHVVESGGTLELLPIDPEAHPAQRAYHIEGDPQSAGIIESVAQVADPRFPRLQEQLVGAEETHQEISRIGELLRAGNNVIVATNHGALTDIALAQAAIYGQLTKKHYQPRSAIIIGKMVSMLGYKLGSESVPAADALKILCHDIFLSFPRTETVKRSALSTLAPDYISRHNRHMVSAVDKKLHEGGMLLAVAPSGTVDKPRDGDTNTLTLGTLGKGTIKLLRHEKTLVVPIATWLDDNQSVLEICDIPRVITDEAMAHSMMERLASALTANVAGKTFRYHTPRSVAKGSE